MILTVTLNPLLEQRFVYNSILLGTENRNSDFYYAAGGKGINVSRQLNKFDVKNLALTFLGGHNGKILRRVLETEKINHSVVSTKSETRTAALVIEKEKKQLTTFFGPNSEISEKEVSHFLEKLEKAINNYSIIVFSGSSPNKFTDEIFPYGIELANKYDKISVLDTYGNHLKKCLEKGPTVFHGNIKEISESLSVSLSAETEKINFLNYLYSQNIKLGFLTDGANAGYANKFNFHYKFENPEVKEIDGTGSGDAFVAGIVYGLNKSMVFDHFTKLAASLGALNASQWSVCSVNPEDAEKLSEEVILTPVGKKMKLIDDSPTI